MIKVYIIVSIDYQCVMMVNFIEPSDLLHKFQFLVYQIFSKYVFFDIFSGVFLFS